MSTATDSLPDLGVHTGDWLSGLVAGLVAAAFGGALFWWRQSAVGLEPPAPVAGTLLFGLASLALGVVYAAAFDRVRLRPWAHSPVRGLGLGVACGLALWVVFAQLVTPFVMPALGYAAAPSFPYLCVVALVGLVYATAVRSPITADVAPALG